MINRGTFTMVYIMVNTVLFICNPVNPKTTDMIFSRVTNTGRSFIDFPLLHFIPVTEMNILKMMLTMSKIELKYILYIWIIKVSKRKTFYKELTSC